ncbi:glycosyltransferase family 1 protein [Domibacillus sp. DTU_2020_1001157_1_SI_ALB_TIR_016]|uniref:glycosyltransferase family 1 protein n=1 Tax=Domibacillus sp. DTU_2020_1001157_1_SI_ALB_TIR_016 TaxID=3077789 RepID=UPI0028E6B64A|nr:glycosyltransferase family 1 protein [Domibacillus sp. DTU_2020_1001157_1_SI_ALB_TIR_016]WNS81186.1 glycosyltransferase family 1 protein [Domibacillus sp. DTU_2020_1001157_1_SI_ALB_TIR_016]
MIKILHYGLSSNRGGIETYLHKIWTHVDRSKFHFDFIDTNIETPSYYDEFSKLGSNFYKITPRHQSIMQNKKDLENLFKSETFDILHCHLNTLSYIEPIKLGLRNDCKVILHSRSAGASNSVITNTFHYINSFRLPKNQVKKVAVSELAGRWLFGKNSEFQTLNNGIDIEKFKFNKEKREIVRKELKVEDKLVVGNVGAFLYAKNHKFIIKIFHKLVQKKPESVLLLVGTGFLKEKIQEMVNQMGLQEKVLFLGRRTDVHDLLSAMDCFLFPSFYEGFPNAVLEAQTSGLPSVISDTITDEVVLTNSCVQLSLTHSPDYWANQIINNFNKVEDRIFDSQIVKNAGFSVTEEVKRVETLYYESLS